MVNEGRTISVDIIYRVAQNVGPFCIISNNMCHHVDISLKIKIGGLDVFGRESCLNFTKG